MKKTKVVRAASFILAASMLSGCLMTGCTAGTSTSQVASSQTPAVSSEAASEAKPEEKAEPITLKFALSSKVNGDYFNEVNLPELYKKVNPNVTIEIEQAKDDTQMAQTIKIQKAANELPDVMDLKKEWMISFADSLVPLDELDCAKKSPMSSGNIVDGHVMAVIATYFTEFVYYKKSIFKEYDLQVPQTWDEFINAALKIKEGDKYIPILMGGKDAWPDYPFNEQMPILESGSGTYWSDIAAQDEPFSPDSPFYKAYEKVQKLYDAKVFGQDPLGMGWDQVKVMFGSKGAMIVSGQWYLEDAKAANNGDASDIGVFFLPTRDKADDKQNYLIEGDGGLAISKNSENVDAAKEFIEWYFSKDFLPGLAKASNNFCVYDDYGVTLDPQFDEAFENVNLNKLPLDSGNADYVKIRDAIQFDVKKMGQDMMAGKDYQQLLADLNVQWKDARASLGIK